MQNSSAFQFIAIDQIRESATNPRQTFEQNKLEELADFVPRNKIGFLWR
jgi:ParB family chromosome partitioning protein